MFLQETYEVEDLLFYPKLDGTETIHQIQGSTTISNNEMSGGSGYENYASFTTTAVNDTTGSQLNANTDYDFALKIENGSATGTINTFTDSSTLPSNDLRYVGVFNWTNAKTITFTDFKIKAL